MQKCQACRKYLHDHLLYGGFPPASLLRSCSSLRVWTTLCYCVIFWIFVVAHGRNALHLIFLPCLAIACCTRCLARLIIRDWRWGWDSRQLPQAIHPLHTIHRLEPTLLPAPFKALGPQRLAPEPPAHSDVTPTEARLLPSRTIQDVAF